MHTWHTDRSTPYSDPRPEYRYSPLIVPIFLLRRCLCLCVMCFSFANMKDDGFAPALAFQTMAAEGTSGLLCAQIQALVQTAVKPLARCFLHHIIDCVHRCFCYPTVFTGSLVGSAHGYRMLLRIMEDNSRWYHHHPGYLRV